MVITVVALPNHSCMLVLNLQQTTCVFIFFALNLAMFDGLDFPAGRSRKENVTRMVDSIFKVRHGLLGRPRHSLLGECVCVCVRATAALGLLASESGLPSNALKSTVEFSLLQSRLSLSRIRQQNTALDCLQWKSFRCRRARWWLQASSEVVQKREHYHHGV